MEITEYGYVKLGAAIIEQAIDDYRHLLRRERITSSRNEKRICKHDIEYLENRFFRTNPIMGILPCTSEDVIDEIRRQVAEEIKDISMSTLNYLCENDISDDDCYKCSKRGIVFRCPNNCPDFADARKGMSPEMLAERTRLMQILGVKDEERWDE